MQRIVYTETGGPEVLRVVEEPDPHPGPGEVRVRIHRSGINPTDWKSRRGAKPGDPIHPPQTPPPQGTPGRGPTRAPRTPPPQTPNHDGAGVVDAAGDGVGSALTGLRVWV